MVDDNLDNLGFAKASIDSQLPVVFMSREAWRAYRGLECLAKPLRPAELVERVSRALNADTPLNTHTH